MIVLLPKKTTQAIKILRVVLSPICNMYAMTPLWNPCLHKVMINESLFALTVA